VGTDAGLDAGAPDSAEVGAGEVSLAEMHEVRAEADRFAPIVVDHKLAAKRQCNFERLRDLGLDRGRWRIRDAQLDEPSALARNAGDPAGVGRTG
jgi:hypothetical protein